MHKKRVEEKCKFFLNIRSFILLRMKFSLKIEWCSSKYIGYFEFECNFRMHSEFSYSQDRITGISKIID